MKDTSASDISAALRVAVQFVVNGDKRFLAHQEMLRLFARACVRAELPVRMSQGFNPKPRLSLPLPRPVGIASNDERLVMELESPVSTDEIVRRLGAQMPADIEICDAAILEKGDRSQPDCVRYEVMINGFDGDRLRRQAESALGAESLPYDRFVHKLQTTRRIDLRPYISTIDLNHETVSFTLLVTSGGTARPSEICDLLGIGGSNVNHLIRRMETTWQ